MWKKLFTPEDGRAGKPQSEISSWDVVVLSFKLMFQQIQFWIRPNIWMVLLSLPVITGPGAKAALYQTVAAGLKDPALTHTNPRQEVKTGFYKYIWRALGLSVIKWGSLGIILIATWFWISQETWLLRSISVITIYFLVMWWLSAGYLYPVLIENPDKRILQVVKEAIHVAFRRPFDSLLFALVSTLLLVLGLILLGPILLIVPALRSLIHLQGYWLLTRQVIPGFMDLVEYTEKYYD
jgi:hypothetical protein